MDLFLGEFSIYCYCYRLLQFANVCDLYQSYYANFGFVRRTELFGTHLDVFLLRPKCSGTGPATVPLVETLSHTDPAHPVHNHRSVRRLIAGLSSELSVLLSDRADIAVHSISVDVWQVLY